MVHPMHVVHAACICAWGSYRYIPYGGRQDARLEPKYIQITYSLPVSLL
jgi:hypothetical protein